MAGAVVGMDSGLSVVEYVLCESCGHERRGGEFVDCVVCILKSERLALGMELGELRSEVRQLREEVSKVREEVSSVRQASSVRPKDRQVIGGAWSVVGEGRGDRCRAEVRPGVAEAWPVVGKDRRRAASGESDRGKVEGNRKDSGKLTIRRVDGSQEWQVVSRGRVGTGATAVASSEPVGCRNSFSLLGEVGLDEVIEVPVAESERVRVDGRKGSPEVLVVGDSMVRYLDRTFCEKQRKKRMRVCFPGAGVRDVTERYDRVVAGSARESVVVLHVGSNDVERVRSEELIGRYRELLEKVGRSGRKCIMSGVLPRMNVGSMWHARAIGLNERVKEMCRSMNVQFMDEWSKFYGRKELYAIDKVHLSKRGVDVLSDCLERAIGSCFQGN